MFRLTINMIFDLLTHLRPFQIAAEIKTKSAKFDCDINFITEPSTVEKIVMHP